MARTKYVPEDVEKEYIKLSSQKELIDVKFTKAKKRLLRYHEMGYAFTLIRPTDTSGGVFSPPWKQIALELIQKLFKTKTARTAFMRSLVKRFPRRDKAPSFKIMGKKSREFTNAV